MDKYQELRQIFKGIITDLGFKENEIEALTTTVRTPQEMAKVVDKIEQTPNITYEELFEYALSIIDFEIEINQ